MKNFQIPRPMTELDFYWSAEYINANIAEFQRELLPYKNQVINVTYHNDECASMQVDLNGTEYLVFLPNAKEACEGGHQFPSYCLIKSEEYAEHPKTLCEYFDDIEKLTEYLKEIQNYNF